MTTKVNKQLKQNRHKVDKVIQFPIATGQPDTSHLDPKLKISDHEFYMFTLVNEKLTGSRNAAAVHIEAMNIHQKAMDKLLIDISKPLGINFHPDVNKTDYVFNINTQTFIHKSIPKSKGGLGPEPVKPPVGLPAK